MVKCVWKWVNLIKIQFIHLGRISTFQESYNIFCTRLLSGALDSSMWNVAIKECKYLQSILTFLYAHVRCDYDTCPGYERLPSASESSLFSDPLVINRRAMFRPHEQASELVGRRFRGPARVRRRIALPIDFLLEVRGGGWDGGGVIQPREWIRRREIGKRWKRRDSRSVWWSSTRCRSIWRIMSTYSTITGRNGRWRMRFSASSPGTTKP